MRDLRKIPADDATGTVYAALYRFPGGSASVYPTAPTTDFELKNVIYFGIEDGVYLVISRNDVTSFPLTSVQSIRYEPNGA